MQARFILRLCLVVLLSSCTVPDKCVAANPGRDSRIPASVAEEVQEAVKHSNFGLAANLLEGYAKKRIPQAMFEYGYWTYQYSLSKSKPIQEKEELQRKAIEWIMRAANSREHSAAVFLSEAYKQGMYPLAKDLQKSNYWKMKSEQR